MPTLIVLFNLKPGVSAEAYESFARTTDLPIVRQLPSIAGFEVLKSSGLLGGGKAPYEYVEVIQVRSLEQLGKDVATPEMQKVATTFRTFADDPKFMITASI